jgi:hypothetical protein
LKDKFKPWLGQVEKDSFSAYCKLCSISFTLRNMGEQALTSHMHGKKHKLTMFIKQYDLSVFYSAKDSIKENALIKSVLKDPVITSPNISLVSMLSNVTKAEILWCMHVIVSHSSQ